jgi:hypothetical protein
MLSIISRIVIASGTVSLSVCTRSSIVEIAAGVEGVVQGRHHRLLDLGAGEVDRS